MKTGEMTQLGNDPAKQSKDRIHTVKNCLEVDKRAAQHLCLEFYHITYTHKMALL